jgi:hypothetical protein
MKMIVRMVLLALVVLGGCREQKPEIEKPEIENHGWNLIFVRYNEGDTTATAKDSRFYGMPLGAAFAKDYPFEVGKEYPKILVAHLEYSEQAAQKGVYLIEFDCDRRLYRQLRTFKMDGSETMTGESELQRWADIPKGDRGDAMVKYACRPRTVSKP